MESSNKISHNFKDNDKDLDNEIIQKMNQFLHNKNSDDENDDHLRFNSKDKSKEHSRLDHHVEITRKESNKLNNSKKTISTNENAKLPQKSNNKSKIAE